MLVPESDKQVWKNAGGLRYERGGRYGRSEDGEESDGKFEEKFEENV